MHTRVAAHAFGRWHDTWTRCARVTMKRFDAEEIVRLTDDRRTVDLCHQERDGVRCMRHRGHDGQHECVSWRDGKELSWAE